MCCNNSMNTRDRAVICYCCPERYGPTQCDLYPKLTIEQILLSPKPICSYHEKEPIIYEIKWIGVPYPFRIICQIFHKKHPKPNSFSGCGCIKSLKDKYGKLQIQINKIQNMLWWRKNTPHNMQGNRYKSK